MTDFVACLVEHFGTKRGPHLPQDQFNHIEHAELDFIGEVKSLAVKCGIRSEALGEQHESCGSIFDIDIVADKFAVGAYDRSLSANDGANRARDHRIPVQIGAAVEILSTRD